MIYYVILSFLFLGVFFNKNQKINKLIFIGLGIFFVFSKDLGSDILNYKYIYNYFNLSNINYFTYEKGFLYYTLMLKNFFNFGTYYAITKIFIFYFFYKTINELGINDNFLYLLFYIQLGIYLFLDCPFRNLIAIGLFLIATLFYIRKKILGFLLFSVLSFVFHKTGIICMLIPILMSEFCTKKIFKLGRKKLIVFLIIVLILIRYDILLKALKILAEYLPIIQTRLLKYSYKIASFKGNGMNIQLIEKSLLVFIGIWNRKKIIKKFKYGKEVIIFSIFFLILYRVSNQIPILFRFQLYFRIFYLALAVYISKIIKENFFKLMFVSFYFMYSLGSLYYILTKGGQTLIPYRNYLFNWF